MLSKSRIEAFSDGVIAIIITIMAFELKIPELSQSFSNQEVSQALVKVIPKVLSYTLSFVVVGILWLNHHTMFDKIPHVGTKLIWHNLFLLFAMSLIPMPTSFLASYPLLPQAVMFYGFIMFLNAFGFLILRRYVEIHAKLIPYNSTIQKSNWISCSLYLLSIPLALASVYLSFFIFIGIPIWYFLPDRFHK